MRFYTVIITSPAQPATKHTLHPLLFDNKIRNSPQTSLPLTLHLSFSLYFSFSLFQTDKQLQIHLPTVKKSFKCAHKQLLIHWCLETGDRECKRVNLTKQNCQKTCLGYYFTPKSKEKMANQILKVRFMTIKAVFALVHYLHDN